MSDKYLVCSKCSARVHPNAVTIDHDPGTWGSPFRETCEKIDAERGVPKPPVRPYHQRHAYARSGGTSHMWLCGPLEEESDQEAYINWVGSLK